VKSYSLLPPKLNADSISLRSSALIILLSFKVQIPKCYIAWISREFRKVQRNYVSGRTVRFLAYSKITKSDNTKMYGSSQDSIGKGSCNGSGFRTSNCRPLLLVTDFTTHISVTCLRRFKSHSGMQSFVFWQLCDKALQPPFKKIPRTPICNGLHQARAQQGTYRKYKGFTKKKIVTLSNNKDTPKYDSGKITV
jgi:hypothetical protein